MDRLVRFAASHPVASGIALLAIGLVLYLALVNKRMTSMPDRFAKIKQPEWTEQMVREAYARLEKNPKTVESTKAGLPPKLDRRYIITGGCGLVGGYIVLQLLARGQPPESIRIVDFQKMHRKDMLEGPARDVDVIHTDIASPSSTEAAFAKPWPKSVAKLPLTVFHTAALMVPSDRSQFVYDFLERVNVNGSKNVLNASRRAGADVLVATASASISLRYVRFLSSPWRLLRGWPKGAVQLLDDSDFFRPLRSLDGFYSAYAASKATAERIICGANSETLRTGTVRPANGIYGHPTDNTLGNPINKGGLPTWCYKSLVAVVHGMNCAVAHLDFEAVLANPRSSTAPQAGRPFTVTDPNPPVLFGDIYRAVEWLSVTPFHPPEVVGVLMLLVAYIIEAYMKLPRRFPALKNILPPLTGDVKHLQPGLFTVVTHVYATNDPVSKPVKEGGLGYRGLLTTTEGVAQQVLEWNREHQGVNKNDSVEYKSSISLAEDYEKIVKAAKTLQK